MNTVQSFSYSDDDQSQSRREWRTEPREQAPTLSPEINRMLSAAVVSSAFQKLLLSDPVAALTRGYNGESFELQAEELAQIVKIRAESLAEFAGELIDRLWFGNQDNVDGPGHRRFSRPVPVKSTGREPAMAVVSPGIRRMDSRAVAH